MDHSKYHRGSLRTHRGLCFGEESSHKSRAIPHQLHAAKDRRHRLASDSGRYSRQHLHLPKPDRGHQLRHQVSGGRDRISRDPDAGYGDAVQLYRRTKRTSRGRRVLPRGWNHHRSNSSGHHRPALSRLRRARYHKQYHPQLQQHALHRAIHPLQHDDLPRPSVYARLFAGPGQFPHVPPHRRLANELQWLRSAVQIAPSARRARQLRRQRGQRH